MHDLDHGSALPETGDHGCFPLHQALGNFQNFRDPACGRRDNAISVSDDIVADAHREAAEPDRFAEAFLDQ
ncbi:hypothetical protein [Paracoccus sp. M683]|uniref:hypothetical protein n=1 Tax=Paracoccus sp. M683 TaxID=2594268 RepID=UPI00163D82DC|nr:hypothetical protein [Paracoccus sp. M683]